MGTANRIALYGALCAVLAYITPLGQSAYEALFPDKALALMSEQMDSMCLASWILTPGNEDLRDSLWADRRQLARWEKEGRITHAKELEVSVSARGNADRAVVIRDLSIKVVSRQAATRGDFVRGGGCGGEDEPEFLVVDLDGLPLNQDVPVSYLQHSAQQKDARKAAAALGKPISLPHQVTTDGSYSFYLTGRSAKYTCAWVATVTWWDGEKEHHDRIDNDGRPFRVSATAR